MLRKLLGTFGLFAALFALVITPALASVTFDPISGQGFVGKGDVQLAFGWNNAQLQANAGGVTFTYNKTDTYEATCSWVTGEGTRGEQTHYVDHTASTTVISSAASDTRKNAVGSVNGFNLIRFGTTIETGEVPVVGGACMGNEGHEGTWSHVSDGPISSTGGLYVNYPGLDSVLLPITPPAV